MAERAPEERLADLLQEHLDRTERGGSRSFRARPIRPTPADPTLAAEAAELAALAEDLRRLPLPGPDPARADALRRRVLADLPDQRRARPGLWTLAAAVALAAALAVPAGARVAALRTLRTPAPTPLAVSYAAAPAPTPTAAPIGRLALRIQGLLLDDPSVALAPGPDGRVWLVEPKADRLSVLKGAGNTESTWSLPGGGRTTGLAVGPGGEVWLAQRSPGALTRLDPAAGRQQSWPLPDGAAPGPLAVGSDGRVWLTAGPDRRLYAFDPARGAFTARALTGVADLLWADGRLWAAGPGGQISALDAAGRLTTYAVPGDPTGLAWDGRRLWYAAGDLLGELDPAAGAVRTFPLAGGRADRVAAADGAVWFIARGSAALGRLAPATGAVRLVRLDPMVSELADLVPAGGRIWLAGRPQGMVIAVAAVS